MGLTSRQKRPLDRAVGHLRDTKLIVIAVEGEKTEKQYFDMFRNVRVQVRVLPTGDDHASAPEHVLARLAEFKDGHEFEPGDEFWFMTDVDRWGPRKLSLITREAVQKGYGLAISNPCFEYWMYLHLDDPPPDWSTCSQFKEGIRGKLGSYNSSNLNTARFEAHVGEAVRRSKMLEDQPDARRPRAIGSHVYRVVERITATDGE